MKKKKKSDPCQNQFIFQIKKVKKTFSFFTDPVSFHKIWANRKKSKRCGDLLESASLSLPSPNPFQFFCFFLSYFSFLFFSFVFLIHFLFFLLHITQSGEKQQTPNQRLQKTTQTTPRISIVVNNFCAGYVSQKEEEPSVDLRSGSLSSFSSSSASSFSSTNSSSGVAA